MNILKYIYYIPMVIMYVLNITFLGVIIVHNYIGKGIEKINDKIADIGDYFDSKINPNRQITNQALVNTMLKNIKHTKEK